MILVLNIFWKFKTKMMILILNKCHYQENDLYHQKEVPRKSPNKSPRRSPKSMTVQSIAFPKNWKRSHITSWSEIITIIL